MNNNDLISRDAFKRTLIDKYNFYPAMVNAALQNEPAVDAVEVVRCKNCKYRAELSNVAEQKNNKLSYCVAHTRVCSESDFCSFGVKIDGVSVKKNNINPSAHAHWIICSDGYYPYCSECGEEPQSGLLEEFCPNCLSHMDNCL